MIFLLGIENHNGEYKGIAGGIIIKQNIGFGQFISFDYIMMKY